MVLIFSIVATDRITWEDFNTLATQTSSHTDQIRISGGGINTAVFLYAPLQ